MVFKGLTKKDRMPNRQSKTLGADDKANDRVPSVSRCYGPPKEADICVLAAAGSAKNVMLTG
jgi:hypothetical protein